tara:strand:+ start:408143 stop:408787 length:645 start_codon:yes stop_codon:yes gene_type:complete
MEFVHTSVLSVLFAITASNASIFDFEDQAQTTIGGVRSGAHTSLTLEDDGLEMTIYRSSGAAFDIFPNNTFGPDPVFMPPVTWMNNSWDPFWDVSQTDDTIILNFSSMVSDFSFRFGDFGDDDDDIYIEGYAGLDGTGDLVDSNYEFLEGNDTFEFTSGALLLTGALRSVVIFTGGDFTNSIFIDNIRATGVPSAPSLAILGMGALVGTRRRRA